MKTQLIYEQGTLMLPAAPKPPKGGFKVMEVVKRRCSEIRPPFRVLIGAEKKQKSLPLLFILHFSLFILMGCSSQHKLQRLENKHPELFKTSVKDSVSTKIRYVEHDSVITQPAESVTLHDTFTINQPCPEHYEKTYHSGMITATLNIDSGKVSVTCHEDSLQHEIHFRDVIIDSLKYHSQVGIVMHNVYQTRWYDKIFRVWFLITFGFLAGWVVVKYAKGKF